MAFPQHSIVSAFMRLEQELFQFTEMVPLVAEHLKVWSPALVPCIFEACTQLDSLWKVSGTGQGNNNISDHFESYGKLVAGKWLVVWAEDGYQVRPFKAWANCALFNKAEYQPLPWWQAYNQLKHNRWENVRDATLQNAINAVGGLFLAILKSPDCIDAIAETDWCHSHYDKASTLRMLTANPEDPGVGITVESKLLSYAMGSTNPEFERYLGGFWRCSPRFGRWLGRQYNRESPSIEL